MSENVELKGKRIGSFAVASFLFLMAIGAGLLALNFGSSISEVEGKEALALIALAPLALIFYFVAECLFLSTALTSIKGTKSISGFIKFLCGTYIFISVLAIIGLIISFIVTFKII